MPSVSSAYIQSTVSYLVSLGVNADNVSLTTQKHDSLSGSSRVDMDVYVELLNQGVALTNNSLFGFELGKHIQAKDYGVLGYLVESCENLAQAINALTRFDALVADIGTTSVFFEPDNTRVEWVPKSADCKQMVLRNTTAWVATVYKILGSACKLNAVTFTFPLSAIIFPQHLLHIPFTSENKAMFSALVKVSEEELMASKGGDRVQFANSQFYANQHEDISHRVVALLKANPTLKGCDQQRVANALFISPRTLQRKLKHHSIADTADLLGFQEQSSFTHAFKKWYSTTPLKYQKQLLAP